MTRKWVGLVAAVLLVIAGISVAVTMPWQTPTPHFAGSLSGGPPLVPGCVAGATDQSTLLENFINNATGPSVTLPYQSCWTINSTVDLENNTNLTVYGNGAELIQGACFTGGGLLPYMLVGINNGLTLENFTIEGANASTYPGGPLGCGSGEFHDYPGVEFESTVNTTMTNVGVFGVQGDFISVQVANNVPGNALNTNLIISNSTWVKAGYRGLVVEAVGPTPTYPQGGMKVFGNTFRDINAATSNPIDFEYDIFFTQFSGGFPTVAAEDNVLISNNTWANYTDVWFASLQPQNGCGSFGGTCLPTTPGGVQEQNDTLSANTIVATAPLVQINTSAASWTTPKYLLTNLTIVNNTIVPPNVGLSTSSGPPNSAMTITGGYGITISHNSFPIQTLGVFGYFATNTTNLTVTNNNLDGATAVRQAGGVNPGLVQCGNTYGVPPTAETPC